MRKAILVFLALSVATPALGAESEAQRDAQTMADKLNNPATQKAMSGAVEAVVGALLDMRVDGVAKALEPLNKGKPIKMKGRTLREMAARDEPDLDKKIAGGSRAAVVGMGALAQALATMLPQLEQAMDKMGDAVERAGDTTHRN